MSREIRGKINAIQPLHSYFNIEMVSSDALGLPSNNLTYTETRNLPFLPCPSNYNCAVARFSLDTTSVPVFVPQVVIGQVDPNMTVYAVSLYNGSSYSTQNIIYIPNNSSLSVTPPLLKQDFSNTYYEVYSMQSWINMINIAFNTCSNNLGLAHPPFLFFDTKTSLMTFYVPLTYLASNIKIFVNNQLKPLLNTFNFKYIPSTAFSGLSNAFSLQFVNYTNLNTQIVNGVNYWLEYQESQTLAIHNPVRAIVFTNSLMATFAEYTNPPSIVGVTSISSIGNNADSLNILTDFEVPISNGDTYNNAVYYQPDIYRFIDLMSSSPLESLTISVFWKDKFGHYHPIHLEYGCACSIKMVFQRKDYYSIRMPILDP